VPALNKISVRGMGLLRFGWRKLFSSRMPQPDNLVKPPAPPVAETTDIQSILSMEESLSGWFDREAGDLLRGFSICREDVVLDIGCGDGGFTHFCAERCAEIYFADIDAEKIGTLAQTLVNSRAHVHPIVTDANPIPLGDAVLDKIVAMEVLEHVDDPRQFMSELVRVGRPGALYLLTVPDAVAEHAQKLVAPGVYFEKPNHVRIFAREEFERLVLESGLLIEKKSFYGFYWSVWWFFFWACKHDLTAPWHPLLESWTRTWGQLLALPDGPRIKRALDDAMPKSQVIIARKPVR